MGRYRSCLLIIISSTCLKLRHKHFQLLIKLLELIGLCNRDLAEQQIAHKDTDERKEWEGIITIKKQMTI